LAARVAGKGSMRISFEHVLPNLVGLLAVQGTIQFRVVLAATGKVTSVKILKGLPFGLNESAIHAACKIEFRPALKDGQPVTQWLKGEYTFRLESSIFRN